MLADLDTAAVVYLTATAGLVGLSALWLSRYLEAAHLLTAGLCLSVFSGNWQYLGLPLGPDRVLLALGLWLTLVRAWRDRHTRILAIRPVHVALFAVGAFAVGSALWVGTLGQRASGFALLDKLGLLPYALFALAPLAFRTERQRNILLVGLVVLGGYLGVTALAEGSGLRALVFPSYINDPGIGIHFDRARGPFVAAGANGVALFGCFCAAVIGVVMWDRRKARIAASAVALTCVVGIVLTLTRQAWLGAILGVALVMIVDRRLRRFLLPTAVATGCIAAIAFLAVSSIAERAEEQRPLWDRLNSNRAAVMMVAERPLLGFGWGRFGSESPDYYRLAADYPLTSVGAVHNFVLGLAVDLGLVGACCWLLAFALAVLPGVFFRAPPGVAPWRLGLIAFTTCWATGSALSPSGYAFTNYLLWLWAGVVWGLIPNTVLAVKPSVLSPIRVSAGPASMRTGQ